MNSLWSDTRYALRSLLGAPAFAGTILLTLTLGIGGTSAIFSFVEGVLLRPLDYPRANQLVTVCEVNAAQGGDWCGASPKNLADWRAQTDVFEALGLARNWRFSRRGAEHYEAVAGGIASTGLFEVFSVRAARGRLFEAEESEPGRQHVAVASWEFWQSRLGADDSVLDQPMLLDGESYTLVGVLPPGFEIPDLRPVDVWIPLWPETPGRADYRWWRGFRPFGRLAEGVSLATAQATMDTIAERLAAAYPETNAGWEVHVETLRDRLVGGVRPALLVFLGAVGFVLLIACANVANLLLARSTTRRREMAVRASLGADSWRLVRQMVTESLTLALLGGFGGIALAGLLVELFRNLAPADFPRLDQVRISGLSIAVTAAVAILTGLLFSILPALEGRRADLRQGLTEGRTTTASRGSQRLRALLAAAEVALALILVTSAALLARSFADLADWSARFERGDLLTVQLFPAPEMVPERDEIVALYDRIHDEVAALPETSSVGLASAGPLFGGDGPQEVWITEEPVPPAGQRPVANWYDVGPSYFATLGVPLLEGRGFDTRDRLGTTPVAIVNRTLADRLRPGRSPIGSSVHLAAHQTEVEVIGVVADTLPLRSDELPAGEIYWPYSQRPRLAIHLLLRHTGVAAQPTIDAVRARLAAIDPDLDVRAFQSMEHHLDRQLVQPRFTTALVLGFAALALVMATIGTYGVIAFSVSRRRNEIGLRVALGAAPQRIWTAVVGSGLKLAMAGVAAGLAGAWAVTRLLRSLLVGISATDPLTFASTALLLLVVAAVASAVPARRAARIDPMTALRDE